MLPALLCYFFAIVAIKIDAIALLALDYINTFLEERSVKLVVLGSIPLEPNEMIF